MSSSSLQRPSILTDHSQSLTKVFAYYSIHCEHNQMNQLNNLMNQNELCFEINSCLYFQKPTHNDDNNEWKKIHQDGCECIINYPSHIHSNHNLQPHNFDRTKNFLLTSNDVYSNSKTD